MSNRPFTVQLVRDALDCPWGFRLHGGSDFKEPLKVTRVISGHAADGVLHVGDIILKINNEETKNLAHEDAYDLISMAGSVLVLEVLRRPEHVTFAVPVASLARRHSSDEPVIPKNENLARLMRDSLSRHPFEEKSHRSNQSSFSQGEKSAEAHNILSYLPRATPSGHILRRGSSTPRETHIRSQVRDTLLRSPSAGSSGRSSPVSLLEMRSPDRNAATGIWTPPPHMPNVKLVHLQYNSPLNIYTPQNVADMLQKTTGGTIQWLNRPQFYNDISESATYKYIQEIEGRRPANSASGYEQSSTIKNLEKWFDEHGTS